MIDKTLYVTKVEAYNTALKYNMNIETLENIVKNLGYKIVYTY